ncbi:hypothetical protein NDU88_004676 [Pleurodeles waltl]|uniref:Uncharacterized protein n=1 Tax=Pleurodeles waltl TaxID=8319 RepID=A0AAV7V3M4_PLEWA|nr:hypothetical protein NDU88_004676 [Pleurodeles waltl]
MASKKQNTIEEGLDRMVQSTNKPRGGGKQDVGDTISSSMLKLKNLIMDRNRAITEKNDGVATLVTLLRQDMDKIQEKVKDLGTRTDGVDEIVGTYASTLTDHEQWLKMQGTTLGDLRDGLRRNNVRILGLPEGTESTPVETFLESWLPTVLPGIESKGGLQVDRAHRSPGGKPKPGVQPRMLIAGMQRYKDKTNVLAAAHAKRNVEFFGNRISF